MGQKNPDRIPAVEWRQRAETLAQMQQADWDVVSHCFKCGLMMHVDLDVLIWKLGAKASLWNRNPRCRSLRCDGRVTFEAKFYRGGSYQPLTAPWPE
jgi:hypothetical protein